jgi:membrane protein
MAKAINRAHGIREDRPFYLGKPRALLLGAAIFLTFAISVYSAAVITAASRLEVPGLGELTALQWLARVPGFLLTFVTFALTYQLLPSKPTHWRNTLWGATVATVGFEAAKWLFVFYLDRADYGSMYGVFASVIVLMVWSYFSAFIILVGAEVSAVLEQREERRSGEPPPEDVPTGP